MPTQNQTNQFGGKQVAYGVAPREYPRAFPLTLDFSVSTSITIDLKDQVNKDQFEFVECVYADNSANANALTLTDSITGQAISWPPFSQGYLPFMCSGLPVFLAATAGTPKVTIQILNFALPAVIWFPNVGGVSSNAVALAPRITGGLSISRTLSLNTTNSLNIKATPGQLYGWYLSNTAATPAFLKIYDKAAAPTVGTDTPVMTLCIPGNTAGAGANNTVETGIAFVNGIGIGITGAAIDSDVTAVAANAVIANLLFK